MKLSSQSGKRSRFLELELRYGEESLPVQVEFRRQPRARYFRLRVKTRYRALLTMPWHAPFEEAERFLREHEAWLAEHLAKKPSPDSLPEYLRENPTVSVRGRNYALQISQQKLAKRIEVKVDRDGEIVEVLSPSGAGLETTEGCVLVLKEIAKVQLDLRVCDLAERVNLAIPDVSVRDQESRWGSCSSTGRLSLNWRLILLPPIIQDYVIYHELAHLTEMNHSPHFWDLLHTYDPRAGRHDRDLTQHWTFLMHFGRT